MNGSKTWRACADTSAMLEYLEGVASDRKLRLFAVASCRNIWALLVDADSRRAVEVAERFADKRAEEAELKAAYTAADVVASRFNELEDETSYHAALAAAWTAVEPGYCHAAYSATHAAFYAWQAGGRAQLIAQEECLTDFDVRGSISASTEPNLAQVSWNTLEARQMAAEIYEKHLFDQMPALATALEQAGCREHRLVQHCRNSAKHVRGCWVIDLILGLQ